MFKGLLVAALLCALAAARGGAAPVQEIPARQGPQTEGRPATTATAPPAAPDTPSPQSSPSARTSPSPPARTNADDLKKYAGRYELEVGLIPISTLDVTIEGGELWIKPSLIKKRRLTRKSRTRFLDEVEGGTYIFGLDEDGKATSLTFRYEGETYTAARVELPPPSLKGNTTFRLEGYPDATLVTLAGSFNNWNQSQTVCGREGNAWVCRLDLNPGVYTYKFILDGNWLLDPANPETQEDEAGNVNNVIEVRPD
jgi:hypothetical protein